MVGQRLHDIVDFGRDIVRKGKFRWRASEVMMWAWKIRC